MSDLDRIRTDREARRDYLDRGRTGGHTRYGEAIDAGLVVVGHRHGAAGAVFVADDPAPALIEASSRAAALVVGRHGPGGIPSGPPGSVSRSAVQRAHCPVFLFG